MDVDNIDTAVTEDGEERPATCAAVLEGAEPLGAATRPPQRHTTPPAPVDFKPASSPALKSLAAVIAVGLAVAIVGAVFLFGKKKARTTEVWATKATSFVSASPATSESDVVDSALYQNAKERIKILEENKQKTEEEKQRLLEERDRLQNERADTREAIRKLEAVNNELLNKNNDLESLKTKNSELGKKIAGLEAAERARQNDNIDEFLATGAKNQGAQAANSTREPRTITDSGHKGVQLWEGGPYWAETNIGAYRPEDYGSYFQWGATTGYKPSGDKFSFDFSSAPASFRDAAKANWGGGWRMPTEGEFQKMIENCEWSWTSKGGVNGCEVRGRRAYSSAKIFLPAAGNGYGTSLFDAGTFGFYWSSVPDSDGVLARRLFFISGRRYVSSYCRFDGFPVRPVRGFAK